MKRGLPRLRVSADGPAVAGPEGVVAARLEAFTVALHGHRYLAAAGAGGQDARERFDDLATATVDARGEPVTIPGTTFSVVNKRPAGMSKGVPKHFETLYYPPRGQKGKMVRFDRRLLAARTGREMIRNMELAQQMPGYQYYLIHFTFLQII